MAYSTRHSSSGHRPSFLSTVRVIYNEGASAAPSSSITSRQAAPVLFNRFPILKFYRGFTVSVAGMIPYAGTSFLAWGFLRATFLPQPSPSLSTSPKSKPKATPIADLTIGAVAGAVSQTASYPFEVVRRRMQVGGLTQPDRWMRWGETVRTIWMSRGWRGFYVGLSIGYLKVIPLSAVSYAVWQFERRLLGL